MSFDQIIDRRGTNCSKWDAMTAATGVDAPDAISMWIADMDFAAPTFLQNATRGLLDKANYGYFTGEVQMKDAVAAWMEDRHGWSADPAAMISTYGLGNAIAIALHAYTDPGDEVVIFTPVYHEFTLKIKRTKRVVKESPLVIRDGVYHMDLDALDAAMTGREKVLLFCSPHNPAGRIWTADELRAVAAFCAKHDLVLISDEIHHDLVYPGQKHVAFPVAAPEATDRLVMMTSASKSFNIAGSRLGTVTIPDDAMRATFRDMFGTLEIQPNLLGVALTKAAYSAEGAACVDELVTYLDDNQRMFLDAANAIPGVTGMPMQSTYLSWIDFSKTGMDHAEMLRRVRGDARLAASNGTDFGTGGEHFMHFNLAMPRTQLAEAAERLQAAFADLQ